MKNESRPTRIVHVPLLLSLIFLIGYVLVDPGLAYSQGGSKKLQRCQQTAAQIDCIDVYVGVIDPKTVGDVFGKRIGDRFIAVQVTITNHNEKFQYLIHDVSLDLSKIFIDKKLKPKKNLKLLAAEDARAQLTTRENELREKSAACKGKSDYCLQLNEAYQSLVLNGQQLDEEIASLTDEMNGMEMSSLELSLMRGVAEKGQLNDPRNKVYRILRGLGTIAAGLIGVTTFGASYAPSVAVFNGPFLSAYTEAFPDYTVNQMNRLSDSAYKTNTLVPRQQAKIMVAFIPQPLFMGKELRNKFAKDPSSIWDQIDFRQADAIVDGSFIEQLDNLPPLVTDVQIDGSELAKFQDASPEVKGKIVGRGLSQANVKLLAPVPPGLTIESNGPTKENELNFVLKSTQPVSPEITLNFSVSSTQGTQAISRGLGYVVKAPTLTALTPNEAEADSDELTVELTGTNFLPSMSADDFRFVGPGGVSVIKADFESSTKLLLTLRIRPNSPGARTLKLIGTNDGVPFEVKAPPEPVKSNK